MIWIFIIFYKWQSKNKYFCNKYKAYEIHFTFFIHLSKAINIAKLISNILFKFDYILTID